MIGAGVTDMIAEAIVRKLETWGTRFHPTWWAVVGAVADAYGEVIHLYMIERYLVKYPLVNVKSVVKTQFFSFCCR
jgi:hypothetical protein